MTHGVRQAPEWRRTAVARRIDDVVQSVELLLDDAADDAVRRLWRRLADAGLPSQAHHTGPTNAPHVTLSAHASLPDGLDGDLAAAVGPLPLAAPSTGVLVFDGRRPVVALAVTRSPALASVQAAVLHAVTRAGGPDPLGEHLDPARWTPHVTLAHLRPEHLDDALALVGDPHLDAEAVAVRRWDSDRRVAWTL